MRVGIVGAGGIGATLGARLALAGHEVVLVARGAHLAAMQARGLTLVDHVHGDTHTLPLPASAAPGDFGVQDVVFIGLKAHAIAAMLPRLAPLVGPQTTVVPAINGLPWWYFHRAGGALDGTRLAALDPDDTMFAALDCARVLGCVVHLAAEVRAPGTVHWTSGRRLILGEPDRTRSTRLAALSAALDGAGFEAVASDDIRRDVWWKLIGNLSFNPVAALTGALMDRLCTDSGLLEVIRAAMREGMAVAAHYGYPVAMTPDQRIDVARQLGAAKISMLQDMEQRRPPELAAIVGAVIELADRAGVSVPTVRHLHALTAARAATLAAG